MLGLISFGLKIIFASIIGGALNYIPGESENKQDIVETSLICVLAASILGLARQFSNKDEYLAIGFGILAVIIMVISISKNLEFRKRIILLFSSVMGMIIGCGLFFQACLLGSLVYLILRNSENIMDYFYEKPGEISDSGT